MQKNDSEATTWALIRKAGFAGTARSIKRVLDEAGTGELAALGAMLGCAVGMVALVVFLFALYCRG